ncbi:peptidase S8 family protein [Flavihumibacter petaseus NBRC 106054]|uniref:Peptidase S8 family protein n=1 Tax=Flavihumibacter petaseus NBRC 106054 TaxID=1220578 RepID=A0A0E9N7G8_9BACT|nr:peptidase S8 family protein [Flavihumibacter petaseus NBRC 106054]
MQDIRFRSSVAVRRGGNLENLYFLQFDRIPNEGAKARIAASGITLLEYIPDNTFLATVRGNWNAQALRQLGVSGIIALDSSYKRSPAADRDFGTGRYQLLMATVASADSLEMAGGKRLSARVVELAIKPDALPRYVKRPELLYLLPAPEMAVLNKDATEQLQADLVQKGNGVDPKLDGKGVVIGMGDNGKVYHIDNRYNEESQLYNGAQHATHVAGSLIGAGIKNPAMKGFAPEGTLLVDNYNNIIYKAPNLVRDAGLVLTNNSYGGGSACLPYSGQYTGFCAQVDQQLLDYPELMHVFAAGNSGTLTCGLFPTGYKTIDNSFQAAKNVLTVSGTNKMGQGVNWFSKGPVLDGRLKPEIAAMGEGILSTYPGNDYGPFSGTSMSAPEVTGGLALMYQRYRQLKGGQNPPGDLMKAVICNTATDLGRKGIDFEFGFGWMNLRQAMAVLDNGWYQSGTIGQDEEKVFDLRLEEEVPDLRIMLYWADHPSSFYTLKNLVNDLDISVEYPDGSIHYPQVLDTSAAGVLLPATEGVDHINNIEQVVSGLAPAGNYRIRLKGFAVPFGPQAFRLTWYRQQKGLQLIQPSGGEAWKPGSIHRILWADPGQPADTYTISISTDNGVTWADLPAGQSGSGWQAIEIPAVTSTEARIRLRSGSGSEKISEPFVILPEVAFTLQSPCLSTVEVNWEKPAGIDSVMLLRYDDGHYAEVGIFTGTSHIFYDQPAKVSAWISLAPVLNGHEGERSVGKFIRPAATTCPPTGADRDLAVVRIASPVTIREGTSAVKSGKQPVSVQVENRGSVAFNDSLYIDFYLRGVFLHTTGYKRAIAAGRIVSLDLKDSITGVPGDQIPVSVKIRGKGDPAPDNDNRDTTWRYLANPPLALPYATGFPDLLDTTYGRPGYMGIGGAANWDFTTTSPSLFLKPANVDQKGLKAYSNIDGQSFQLTGTFNLSAYSTGDNIKASLGLPELGKQSLECFFRGSDTSRWLKVNLYDTARDRYDTDNINLSSLLISGKQQFSSSFQVSLVYTESGYNRQLAAIDSFALYHVAADVSINHAATVQSVITDGDSLMVTAMVHNGNGQTARQITTGISIPGVPGLTQLLDSIPAFDSVAVSFKVPVQQWPEADVWVTAWVNHPQDLYHADDSAAVYVDYARAMRQFPYREGFESGAANWSSSYIYTLNTGDTVLPGGYVPANGHRFWTLRHLNQEGGIFYVVPAGALVSPAFDLSALREPYLSMSVNRQLCDGKDSVFLQVSADSGRTWRRFDAVAGTTHWYDSTRKGAWTDCGMPYWSVVSAPLPKQAGLLRFRLVTLGRNPLSAEMPRAPGGMMIDDIHIYDRKYPIYSGSPAINTATVMRDDSWNSFVRNGQIWLASNADGGTPAIAQQLVPTGGSWYSGYAVLPKIWVLDQVSSAGGSPMVRLYFTHAAWESWKASVTCDTCHGPVTPYELSVFRYAGPSFSVDGSDINNLEGYTTVWSPGDFDLVPYDSGYYAEVPAAAYGEFVIGWNNAGSGLDFRAEKQESPEAVVLYWTTTVAGEVLRYEVQRGNRDNGTAPVFETIGTVAGADGSNSYSYRDQQVKPPAGYHYRLRLVMKDGSVRYSVVRTISFEGAVKAILYPNPYSGGNLKLLLQNSEGQPVQLVLYGSEGRVLWSKNIDPQTVSFEVDLSADARRLPAGVYYLNLKSGGHKKVIPFVISGK